MRGVLLVILLFMLLDKHKQTLLKRVGEEKIAKFIHMFKLTILFEAWLDQDSFTRDELKTAQKFTPVFVQTIVNNVK